MNISVSLNIFEYGNPHGTPLILIHGGAGGVWTWEETVKHLGEYRCLLPELPEHGSSQSSGPFSIRATAAQIIQYIRQQIPGGKAHIAGLSVGGQVAIEMLGLAPEAVLSAVVSGALAFPLPGYRLGLYSEAAMTLLYWLGVFPWKKNDAWIRLNMKTMSGMPESSFQAFKRNFQSLTRSGWAHAMSEFYRYRLPEGLETVETPVLLVAGVHEKADTQPTNRLLRRLLPNSTSVWVGEARTGSAAQEHNWSVTFPELCARTIRAWIENESLPEELQVIDTV